MVKLDLFQEISTTPFSDKCFLGFSPSKSYYIAFPTSVRCFAEQSIKFSVRSQLSFYTFFQKSHLLVSQRLQIFMQAKFKVRHKTKMVPFCLNGKYIDKNNDKTG